MGARDQRRAGRPLEQVAERHAGPQAAWRRRARGVALALLLAPALGPAAAAGINVLTAWYGQTCNAQHGNVTAHVKSRCDGKQSCAYTVSADQLGDPAPGCPKNFAVLYACQGQTDLRLAQLPAEAHGRAINFTCDVKRPGTQPTS